MPTCCVPQCKSGYKTTKEKCALFSVPKDPDLLEKWRAKIPRKDRIIRPRKDYVCQKHFLVDDVISVFHQDGTYLLARERLKLKKNAIPSQFPNCPKYLSTPAPKKRKSPRKRNLIQNKKSPPTSPPSATAHTSATPVIPFDLDLGLDCDNVSQKNFEFLTIGASKVSLPCRWTTTAITEDRVVAFLNWGSDFQIEKKILINSSNLKITVYAGDVPIKVEGYDTLNPLNDGSENEMVKLVQAIHEMTLCQNALSHPVKCLGFMPLRSKLTKCALCRSKGDKLRGKMFKLNEMSGKQKHIKRQKLRLSNKVEKLKEIIKVQRKCALTKVDHLRAQIANLPKPQQENIMACLNAAKKFKGQGNRYTTQWIYHCLLLKVRSNKAYHHLRENNVMALPSMTTLRRYIQKMKPTYGFQPAIFKMMKEKSQTMTPLETRGSLVLDEMKLSPSLKFDKKDMRFIGFTDLGEYTPPDQKGKEGDHALVLLFQPFTGSWIQSIGAFLSRGAANGHVLQKIIMEAILLTENSGFQVDAVVTDAANWNRAVWKLCGISETKISCTHFYDETRELHFVSDFPHLVKNLRNWILKINNFWTPDGLVKLEFWRKLITMQSKEGLHLCPKLNDSHINPKQYQKMNVGKAYQFFGLDVSASLKSLHEKEQIEDPYATCQFIEKVNKLISAMSSRTPKGALRIDSSEFKAISDFIEYLKVWKILTDEKKYDFMTTSTFKGFLVSLQAILQIHQMLVTKYNFTYLMTVRLNQDCIEHFFGIVRQAAGNSDHPNPLMFILIFRLMSVYSLVKPPKGSNIEGGQLLKSLVDMNDVGSHTTSSERWQFILDRIVDNGEHHENLELVFEKNESVEFFCGYIAKRSRQFTKCTICLETTRAQQNEQMSTYFNERDAYGALTKPSKALIALIQTLENHVTEESNSGSLSTETFFNIAYAIQEFQNEGNIIVLLGCEEHKNSFTSQIIHFFLVTRMHFICKFTNNRRKEVESSKNLKKLSKLK